MSIEDQIGFISDALAELTALNQEEIFVLADQGDNYINAKAIIAVGAVIAHRLERIEELERNYEGAVALLGPYTDKIEEYDKALDKIANSGPWEFVDMTMETTVIANIEAFARTERERIRGMKGETDGS